MDSVGLNRMNDHSQATFVGNARIVRTDPSKYLSTDTLRHVPHYLLYTPNGLPSL